MPLLGPDIQRDREDLRSAYDEFHREMSTLVQLYAGRETKSGTARMDIDRQITTAEARVRGAWSRLGEPTREPVATHF